MKKMFIPLWGQYIVVGLLCPVALKIILVNPSQMVTDLSIPQFQVEMEKGLKYK